MNCCQQLLLFIPQIIYEHGETWWNDICREIRFVHQNSLEILEAETSSSKAGGTSERNYGSIYFLLRMDFYMP
jgi:hypothetical protein